MSLWDNQNLTNQVNRFLASEIRQKEITDFYNKYHNQIGGYR